MSIAEQVGEMAQRIRMMEEGLGSWKYKAGELESENQRHANTIVDQMREIQTLRKDRDKWKALALKAEEKVSQLKRELDVWITDARSEAANSQFWRGRAEAKEKKVADLKEKLRLEIDRANNTWAERDGYYEETKKLNARIAELERELIDAMAEVGTLKQCAKMDAAEINLLRQQSKSHGLEAVLEELRAGRIPGRIHVDCYGINVSVFCVGGFRHSESVKSFADITAAIEKLVMMHYPDSAFARRRKPAEPTPNSSETPNSSTDELGNRYRRIVDAVDRYFANGCSSNNAFADEVTRIVYPKEAAK